MARPPDPDATLLAACIAGDREPFVARFAPLIAWVVRKSAPLPDPSRQEDLRQEAFLACFEDGCRRLRQFRPGRGCRAASWVGMIARQAVLKRLEAPEPPGAPLAGIPAPVRAELPELAPLRRALASLSDREALCLRLLVEQGVPAEEVAAILRVARQSVYAIRDRALDKLRKELADNPLRDG